MNQKVQKGSSVGKSSIRQGLIGNFNGRFSFSSDKGESSHFSTADNRRLEETSYILNFKLHRVIDKNLTSEPAKYGRF